MNTRLIEWMMKRANRNTFVNPENPSEKTEELSWSGTLREIINFRGGIGDWSITVITDTKVGGHAKTSFHAWRPV